MIAEKVQILRSQISHRVQRLPVLVLMPHSGCNCRCLMCDIWRANARKQEITEAELARQIEPLARLGVRQVVLSGGEALLHRNLWKLCALLKPLRVKSTLLSTGLLLARHAREIARWCDEVVISLDGSPAVHDRIRNLPGAFIRLQAGVHALQAARPAMPVSARCVLQKQNFFDLPEIIRTAESLALAQVSFLAADVSSTAFNRPQPWDRERVAEVALSEPEVGAFAALVEEVITAFPAHFRRGFIAESPAKLRRLAAYYGAMLGLNALPGQRCNAPWVSAVIEADGRVRPCFFHAPIGSIHAGALDEILNAPAAVRFRRSLDVGSNPICRRCTCALDLRPFRLPGRASRATHRRKKPNPCRSGGS